MFELKVLWRDSGSIPKTRIWFLKKIQEITIKYATRYLRLTEGKVLKVWRLLSARQ